MSRTIEQKVVEMRFDNSNFEKNVSKSMDSLNQLKATIDKTSSGNAFSGLSKALDNINIGSVTTAIQTVTEKFSVWEQVAIGAARNIGAAISNYVVKGMNDMVFKNVSVGWDKYAQKTEAVQTIMASIADQDFGNTDKMEYVEGLMEKLNWFTDETSYHLTDMISNIGKFTSAGVDLDKASDAMMGIANWAAVSGANANTASRVMYQLSQSLGLGAVRTQDWMSVETANMATKEFKELAIQVAKTKGTLNSKGATKSGNLVNFQNFRENLKDNWLTSEVLTETLSQYSGFANALNRVYDAYGGNVPTSTLIKRFKLVQAEAKKSGKTLKEVFKEKYDIDVDFSVRDKVGNVIGDLTKNITELGMRAFIAAQEAKTFREAMDSVGDAASTVWMRVYETIFGNYEVAKELWTNLANDLYELFVDPIWLVSDAFEEWSKQGGRSLLFGREVVENDDGTESIIPTGAFDIFIRTVIDASNALRDGFLGALGVTEDNVDEFTGGALMKFSRKILELSKRFQKFVGPVEDLTKKFKNFFGFFTDIIGHIDIFNKKSEDSLDIVGLIKYRFEDAFSRVENVLSRIKSIIGYVKYGLIAFFDALKFNGTSVQNFTDTAENLGAIGDDIAKALSPITLMFSKLGELGKKAGTFISNLIATLSFIPKEITGILRNTNLLSNGAFALKKILEAVRDGFNSAFDSSIFVDIRDAFKFVWSGIKTFIDGFTDNFGIYDKVKTIAKGIGSAINLIGRAIRFLLKPIEVLDGMGVFNEIGKFLSGTVLKALLSIPATIGKIITKIDEFLKDHPQVQSALEGIVTILSSVIKFVFVAANSFTEFIGKSKLLSKVGGWISGVFGKLKESESLVSIGDKISSAFESVVAFFRDDFYFENIGNLFDKLKTKISDFVKESETINNVKKAIEELWENIKKLFSGEGDFEGFGADFMAGFGKGLADNVTVVIKKAKEVGQKVLDAIKEFFGIHSPSTVMEDVGENVVDGFAIGIGNNIKSAVDSIKNMGGSVLNGLTSLLFANGKSGELNKSAEETSKTSAAVDSIKKFLGNIAVKLVGIAGIALPAIAVGKISRGISSLMSPFTAIKESVEAFTFKMKAEIIISGLQALGVAVSSILKAMGVFFIELGAFAILLAVADKISGGKIWTLFAQIATIVGELFTGITLMAKALNSSHKANGKFKDGVVGFGGRWSETADNIKALAEIFESIGKTMLMFAGAIAVLSAIHAKFGSSMIEATKILAVFMGALLLVAFAIAQFTDSQTESFLTLDKSGLAFEHKGWVEGLYAVGAFMTEVGVAMLAMSAAASLIIWASGGDVDVMHEAFQGMMGIMTIALVGLAGIVGITSKMPSTGMESAAKSIKAAGVAMASAAGAIAIIARTVIRLGRAKDADLDKGVLIVAKIGLVLLGFGALAAISPKDTNFKGIGVMAIELAAAMAVFGILIKTLGEMDPNALSQAMRSFITFGIFFGVISALTLVAASIDTSNTKFAAMGFMLLEMAGAFIVMSKALEIMGNVSNLGDAIWGLIASFAALGLLFALVSGMAILDEGNVKQILGATAGLLLVAASISMVSGSLASMGTIFANNDGAMKAALITLAALTVALGALAIIAKFTGPSLLLLGAGVAALGAGVALLGVGFFVFVNTMMLLVAEASLIGGALSDAFEVFLDKFIALGPKISSALAMIFKAIADGIVESASSIINAAVKLIEEIGKSIDQILTLLAPILDKIITFIVERVTLLVELLKPLVEGIATHIMFILNTILVPGIITGLQTILNWILTNIPIIANVIITTVEMIVTRVLALLDVLVNSENGLLAIIRRALMGENGVLTIVEEFIHALLEALRNLTTDLVDTLVYIMGELVRGLLDNIDIILTGVEDAIELIAKHIVSLTDKIGQAIVDVLEGIATSIENHGADIWKAIWHIATAIWNSFWGIFDGDGENSISNLAGNIMEGLGNGIKNFVGKVTSKISDIGSTIIGKFKEVFGIQSPSKVMAGIGEFLDLGLAEGIDDNTAPIFKGINGIGDGIIDSLKGKFLGDDANNITGLFGDNIAGGLTDALGGITDVLDTDDFTPTITPVLDLSEIQNGASQIPGMINSGSGYTVDTTAVVKSAYSPYEYYDGAEKVSASQSQLDYFERLQAKMDEMVNKFASAKVVLDTGAVVGGIVDPMDMALGQRMAQVGRGVYSSTR